MTAIDRRKRLNGFCSVPARFYYDLLEERQQRKLDTVAIVRLEQLYPLSEEALASALSPYPKNIPLTWVQEEPLNMGAYSFIRLAFRRFSQPALAV